MTPEEFDEMKKHTIIGESILKNVGIYQNEELVQLAMHICRWHHERYDGRGYPDGLKGEEIPIEVQVVSIADVYDALVSERVYKKAYSHKKAVEMILNGECGQFNPLLLECLQDIQDRIDEEFQNVENQSEEENQERKVHDQIMETTVLEREKEGSTVALPWHDAAVRLFQKSCSALTFDANFDMIASVVAIHQEELSKADLAGDERFIQQNEKVGFLMKQFTYTIQDSMGIHARPAGLLVKAAAAFKDTTIEISSNGKKADVKRIMAIMSMGVKQGAEVTVTCEGADEDAAAEAMEKFFKENL